jgi:lysophospholipase L1-like esterase
MEGSGHWRIYTSHWDAAQSTWSAETLVSSPPNLEVDERRPSLAFDDHDQLHLAWAAVGKFAGIAHATWDGTDWTSPTWTDTSEPVEAPIVMADGKVRLLWLTPGGNEATPVRQQSVKEMTDPLPRSLPPHPAAVASVSSYVPNRHLAHGDSITCGCYDDIDGQPATPYPTFLERRLDSSVGPSEVINSGKPGEKARAARPRLQETVQIYQPQYLQIMEGTNDVTSNYSDAETAYAVRLLIRDARAELPGIQIVVATLVPRLDHHYELTRATNQQIVWVAGKEHVPVADQWQAFHNYGDWRELFVDTRHPGTTGLHIIADTFFQSMVGAGWLPDDPTPPDAWITSLPPQSECPAVTVAWTGDDGDGTGVASYDVQVRDNGGPWTGWLQETPETSGIYADATPGHSLSFRVRARDQVGNVGDYSAPATTQIEDTTPPESIGVLSLPPYRIAPFTVSWWGYDTCSQVTSYDVEYRVGNGLWQPWLTQTPSSSGDFNPSSPQCGQSYSFRVRAYDGLDNRSVWSDGTESTTLACHAASGNIGNVRETPIAGARLSASPDALGADPSNETGFYTLYFEDAGSYDIAVERDGFGVLPAQQGVTVAGHVTGVDLILPPADDQVDNGGFEKAGWGNASEPVAGLARQLDQADAVAHGPPGQQHRTGQYAKGRDGRSDDHRRRRGRDFR